MHTEKPDPFASSWPIDAAPVSDTPTAPAGLRCDESWQPAPFAELAAPPAAPLPPNAVDLAGRVPESSVPLPLGPDAVAYPGGGLPR